MAENEVCYTKIWDPLRDSHYNSRLTVYKIGHSTFQMWIEAKHQNARSVMAVGLRYCPYYFSLSYLHDLLLIFYLSLGKSCSKTSNEVSHIFCRLCPSWHSATWPHLLVFTLTSRHILYKIMLYLSSH